MSRNVYEESGERSGIIISETTKGWKVEVWTLYDEPNKTHYIAYTGDYQPGFNRWGEAINDYGTTYSDLFFEQLRRGEIRPYRTLTT